MTYNVTANDWKKLYKWSGDFAEEIRQKLPSDFELEECELKSYVFETYLNLAKIYKEGDLSFTSYCFKYAKTHTLRNILREYDKLKKFAFGVDLSDLRTKETNISTKLLCDDILEKMDDKDRNIAEMIINGFSYQEIGKVLKISPAAIVKRMRKYAGLE